jgi:hypothetical protein
VQLEYNRVRNQVKNMVNKLKKKYEKVLSQKAKENPFKMAKNLSQFVSIFSLSFRVSNQSYWSRSYLKSW